MVCVIPWPNLNSHVDTQTIYVPSDSIFADRNFLNILFEMLSKSAIIWHDNAEFYVLFEMLKYVLTESFPMSRTDGCHF